MRLVIIDAVFFGRELVAVAGGEHIFLRSVEDRASDFRADLMPSEKMVEINVNAVKTRFFYYPVSLVASQSFRDTACLNRNFHIKFLLPSGNTGCQLFLLRYIRKQTKTGCFQAGFYHLPPAAVNNSAIDFAL